MGPGQPQDVQISALFTFYTTLFDLPFEKDLTARKGVDGWSGKDQKARCQQTLGQGGLRDKYHLGLLPQSNRNSMTILKTCVHFPETTRRKKKKSKVWAH